MAASPEGSPTSLWIPCFCKGALPSQLIPETPRVSPSSAWLPCAQTLSYLLQSNPSQLPGYLARTAELCAGGRHSRAACGVIPLAQGPHC